MNKSNHKQVKPVCYVRQDKAEDWLIFAVNEAVYTFAKNHNIDMTDEGGFSMPFVLEFRRLAQEQGWAIEYGYTEN